MKTTFILTLAIVLFIHNTYSQTYTYKLLSNDPLKNSKNLNLGIIPVYTNMSSNNLLLAGYGVYGKYRYKDVFSTNIEYKGVYYDKGGHLISPVYNSVNEYKSGNSIIVRGQYYIFKYKKKSIHNIKVKQSGNTTYLMKIEDNVEDLRLIGLRAGFENSSTNIYMIKDYGEYQIYDITDADKTITNIDATTCFGVMNKSNVISFGIGQSIIKDVVVHIEGYGDKELKKVTELYVDFLLAQKMTLDNIYQISTNKEYNIDEFSDKTKYGFKIGYQNQISGVKSSDYYYGIEAGISPGVVESSYFLLLKFGLQFSFGI